MVCLTMIFFLRKALINSWCQWWRCESLILKKSLCANYLLVRSLALMIQREKWRFMYTVLAILVCQAHTVHRKNFDQACGQRDTPDTTAWLSRSTWPSSALMLATIMYFKYHTIFSENIALNSEYFNLHRLEACQNINQYTMLLFIWLQIVIRLQSVNNNCIAFFMTYHTLSLYFAHL